MTAAKDRPYHHGDLRGALILGAVAQVEAVGMEHLSLRSVATEAGVSPSAAYHHFADKDALLSAIATHGFEQLDVAMTASVAAIPRSDAAAALARITAAALAYVTFAVQRPNLFRAAFSGHCPKPQDATGAGNPLIAGLLNDLVATGVITPDLRQGYEAVMWSTVHGMATLVIEGFLALDDVPEYLTTLERMMRLRD
jgi:AcrR family transcriptional regulator